jgi:hypothetical protein
MPNSSAVSRSRSGGRASWRRSRGWRPPRSPSSSHLAPPSSLGSRREPSSPLPLRGRISPSRSPADARSGPSDIRSPVDTACCTTSRRRKTRRRVSRLSYQGETPRPPSAPTLERIASMQLVTKSVLGASRTPRGKDVVFYIRTGGQPPSCPATETALAPPMFATEMPLFVQAPTSMWS